MGPTLPVTDLQVALNNLDTSVGGTPFTEEHYIEVQEGSTAVDIVIPPTLQPTPSFKLIISGEFRNRPTITSASADAIQITVPNVVLADTEVNGAGFGFDCISIGDGINNFECLRNSIHDGAILVNFVGTSSTGHLIINNDLFNFTSSGILKEGGDITVLNNSGLNKDETAALMGLVHIKDSSVIMKQNIWYVVGANINQFCVLVQDKTAPFSLFNFSNNLYFTGYRDRDSFAKISRQDKTQVVLDHNLVGNIGSSVTFTDSDANFVSAGILPGDLLTFETNAGGLVDGGSIVSSANISVYAVVARLSETQLTLSLNTTAEVGQFEYTITRVTTTIDDFNQLSNWVATTGEVGGSFEDPDFADLGFEMTGPTSLYPEAQSPIVQAGNPLVGVENDFDGNVRPADLIALGAHEARGTYPDVGLIRILELIGGISTKAAVNFCIGEEGALSAMFPGPSTPEAPLRGNTEIDLKNARIPISGVSVTDGGLLTMSAVFVWRYLLTFAQTSKFDLSEIADGVLDEFTEMGIVTEDGILLFRMTFPQIFWDPLSIVSPKITTRIRFEGKLSSQPFGGEVGYRKAPAGNLIFEDWSASQIVP